MSLLWVLVLIALLVALFGALPNWSYSAHWGYGPVGGVGLILLVLLILLLMGRI